MLLPSVELAKAFFFDRAIVQAAVDRARARNLSKAGAYVRRNAKGLLRYKTKPSAPGQPPAAHRSTSRLKKRKDGTAGVQAVSPLREFVFFAYDPSSRSVVVGPARLNRPGDAPHALEYGGTSTVVRDGKAVSIHVQARPFMRPAMEKAKRDLPDVWRDSIQR